MFEKRLAAVLPQAFTSNGTNDGQLTVALSTLFVVKQKVDINATGLPQLHLEVKAVLDINTVQVGPIGQNIGTRADLSAYTLGLGANISATEQQRPTVPYQEVERATYAEEPAVARRVLPVDQLGNPYNDTNPLPVAFDGTVSIGNVSIVEGGNTMAVNTDGSINVVVENTTTENVINYYSAITSVPMGVTTTIMTYTVPGGHTAELFRIEYGGDNTAQFDVQINAVQTARRRTSFGGNLCGQFEFNTSSAGWALVAGTVVTVLVTHTRPYLGEFEARLTAVLT